MDDLSDTSFRDVNPQYVRKADLPTFENFVEYHQFNVTRHWGFVCVCVCVWGGVGGTCS